MTGLKTGHFIVGLLPILNACSSGSAINDRDSAAAISFVEADQAPLSIHPTTVWAGNGMICGEFTTPARPGSNKRFIYFQGAQPFGEVEKDASWSGAGDARGDQILYESQQIFDRTWADDCADNAPLGRRISGWFHHKTASANLSTPLTNDFSNDLINKARNR